MIIKIILEESHDDIDPFSSAPIIHHNAILCYPEQKAAERLKYVSHHRSASGEQRWEKYDDTRPRAGGGWRPVTGQVGADTCCLRLVRSWSRPASI